MHNVEALESWSHSPAVLLDRHLTVESSTMLARAVSPSFVEGVNLAVFTFVDAGSLCSDRDDPAADPQAGWDSSADQVVAMLRESLDRHEPDDSFRRIVGELSTRSSAFAQKWAGETSARNTGSVVIEHAVVGPLMLDYLLMPAAEDHVLMVLRPRTAQSRAALRQLADAVRSSESDRGTTN
jgi:hypothetical protein